MIMNQYRPGPRPRHCSGAAAPAQRLGAAKWQREFYVLTDPPYCTWYSLISNSVVSFVLKPIHNTIPDLSTVPAHPRPDSDTSTKTVP